MGRPFRAGGFFIYLDNPARCTGLVCGCPYGAVVMHISRGSFCPYPLVEGEFHTAVLYRYDDMEKSGFGFESQPLQGQGDKGVVVGTGAFIQE